jgi:ATP-dependent RNA helicase DDX55/SPB4
MVPKKRQITFTNFTTSSASILLCTDVAARGLDMPDIDYVVQFDAPTDPTAFAHRCGRTARMGKQGSALLMLNLNEDTYIEFLTIRSLPISELSLDGCQVTEINELLKEFVKGDRDVYDKVICYNVEYQGICKLDKGIQSAPSILYLSTKTSQCRFTSAFLWLISTT